MAFRLRRPSRTARRLWAVAALLVAVSALVVPPWLEVFLTPQVLGQAVIGFLIGLELAYAVALAACTIGALVLAGWLCRRRGDRVGRPIAARGLLLCVSSLLALAMLEAAAAARRAAMHPAPSTTGAGLPELPGRFDEPARPDEVTLAVLGESSAVGVPYESWLSVGSIVAWQLGRAMPARGFRVELLARKGDTLEGQFRELAGLRRRPDALIVYCGHNEFTAGVPWWRRVDHYLDDRPAPSWGLDDLAARFSPLCALIRETADKYRIAIVPGFDAPSPLVDAPAYTPAEFTSRLDGFRRRLAMIAAFGERVKAPTILVVPPANDADFEPNRSVLPADTPRSVREEFARDFLSARRAEDREPSHAIERYRALLRRQPGFAETHYRLGRLLARAGDREEAYRHFVAARDLDGLPMRCLGDFQQAYRDAAARSGCWLVDGQALFHAIGPRGLLDDHLFQDAMHPSLRGQIALAQAIVDALWARRAFGWPKEASPPAIDPAECAAHFGLEPAHWKPIAERGYMFYHATAPLRHDPSHRLARRQAFKAAAGRLAAGEPPEAVGLPNIGVPKEATIRPAAAAAVGDLGPR
jgi:hypothetical protein